MENDVQPLVQPDLVPVAHDTNYEINFYQPQVEGTQWLGYFEIKEK
jgi:hypothetical protein